MVCAGCAGLPVGVSVRARMRARSVGVVVVRVAGCRRPLTRGGLARGWFGSVRACALRLDTQALA